jgi:hypothetical protein
VLDLPRSIVVAALLLTRLTLLFATYPGCFGYSGVLAVGCQVVGVGILGERQLRRQKWPWGMSASIMSMMEGWGGVNSSEGGGAAMVEKWGCVSHVTSRVKVEVGKVPGL